MNLTTHPNIQKVFAKYPAKVRGKMDYLLALVIETAKETEGINEMEITLKWGEPSFITKHGSTLRIDWKEKTPCQYAMYFQCSSRLVSTFQHVFRDTFQYEGNRALIFQLDQKLPVPELKQCIKAALRYHQVKEDITLGI